jgi:hypothetical protein
MAKRAGRKRSTPRSPPEPQARRPVFFPELPLDPEGLAQWSPGDATRQVERHRELLRTLQPATFVSGLTTDTKTWVTNMVEACPRASGERVMAYARRLSELSDAPTVRRIHRLLYDLKLV